LHDGKKILYGIIPALELLEGNIMTSAQKGAAHIFLTELQSMLNSSLPPAGEVRKMVEDISVASGKRRPVLGVIKCARRSLRTT
jgi:hypothetical protein